MINPTDINFQKESHWSNTKNHFSMYRDNKLGFQKEVVTKRDGGGFPVGKPKTYFFIDGCHDEFTDLEKLCEVYNRNVKL